MNKTAKNTSSPTGPGLPAILGPMRLPFLILTPACVLLGIGTAAWSRAPINGLQVALVLIGAVAAHISVNVLNEYFDFKSGLDLTTQRTPFSGGSGTLPGNPKAARSALVTGLVALAITILVGIYFLVVRGWLLLPLGVVGVLTIYLYTLMLVRNPVLSLLAPGIGFGMCMVMGTHFALTGSYTWSAFIASLVPFFLVSNLLLLNQFPDAEADKIIGRKHLPILLGNSASAWVYGGYLLLAYLAIVAGVVIKVLPPLALIGLGTLLAAIPAFIGARKNANNIPQLIPSMGLNVIINIVTPILVAVGLFLS